MNINDDHPEPFPWAAMMAAGFGILRLSSAAFWAMTPRELNAAFHKSGARVAPTRTALEQLMQAFPDER
ncbi:putative phage protein (TIGR02216 family) [Phyllobacterium sp. 1468]|uniref:rcc01693 family protein n=1 Tax=Phyllobacterium sp. 1468 TaxID=2817759 RepID=UPI001AE9D67F|nr:rcc01693 family protein [Phyllobacterium sp. 1468]MDR6633763.1 putative phage protein (TIGR02216 family) [Phyllobacterium sp. 1468]